MERLDKSAKTTRNLDLLISKLSESEVLNAQSMSFVRGGEGEGGENIILIPPPPRP